MKAMLLLLPLAALLAGCGEVPCKCIQPRQNPLITLTPEDLTSATQEAGTVVGAKVELGAWPDQAGMLAAIGSKMKIVDDATGASVDAEVVSTLEEGSFGQSFVELRPKQALATSWHRLVLESVPAGAEAWGALSVRFHPGHRPTLRQVRLCMKVGERSGPEETNKEVDHMVDFLFSEPVSASAGVESDLLKIVLPGSGSGSCEWNVGQTPSDSFGYFCRGFSETDTFAFSVASGLVGSDGSPVTTLAGQSTFEASLVGSTADCTVAQP